jgi:hypothetical protein
VSELATLALAIDEDSEMLTKIVLATGLVLTFATAAVATSKIVTPRLVPDADGALTCGVVNASDKTTAKFELAILDASGNVVLGPLTLTLAPNESQDRISLNDNARHCVITVLKGHKSSLRVSLTADNSAGSVVAAVTGQ